MMKQSIVLLSTLLIVVISTFGQTTKKESTIIGEVVDIKSYVAFSMKADNPDRRGMADVSIAAGNPLGILEKSTGKIYIVVLAESNANANAKLKDYLGLHVYAKGIVHKKAGIQLLVLSDIGKSIK